MAVPASAASPHAAIVPLGPAQVARPFTVAWTGTPSGPAITGYDVRYRRAAWNGRYGAYRLWQSNVSAERAPFSGALGFTYCFSVRARDGVNPVGPWSAESCTALPLDDRQLERSGGWVLAGEPIDYRGTLVRSNTGGAWLRLRNVVARRVYLIVHEELVGGELLVYWNGKQVSHQYLDAPVVEIRDIHLAFVLPRVETGTLVIRVVGGTGTVRVDGVAVLHR